MKKKYIKPCLQLTTIGCETLIAESIGIYNETLDGEKAGWVKEDNTSRQGYNVWNDDWRE